MKLAHPDQLLWGLLAIPIVLAYFATLSRRRQELASIGFWQQTLARRTPWTRWRRGVSLAVQLGVLALLVLALAEPDLSAGEEGRSIVVVIDASASMRATDVAPSRFAQAVNQAQKVIDSLGRRDRAAVVAAGNAPHLLCEFTGDPSRLRAALQSAAARDGRASIDDAVRLARRMLDDIDKSEILVVTDGCFAAARELAQAQDVRWLPVGGKGTNVAITRFEARPSLSSTRDYRILVEVENFQSKQATCTVKIGLAGADRKQHNLKLGPGEFLQQYLSVAAPDGGMIVAELDVRDDLATDNRAQTIVPPRSALRVALQGNELDSVRRALVSIPSLEIVNGDSSTAAVSADVTILNRPASGPLPAGALLVIAPAGDAPGLWTVAGEGARQATIQKQQPSPLLEGIDLRGVVIQRPVQLKILAAQSHAIVSAADESALYTAIERPTGRLLIWHAPLDAGDLSMHTELPLLFAAAVTWLAGNDARVQPSLKTTSTVAIGTSPQRRAAISPSGQRWPLPADAPVFLPLDAAGLWTVENAASTNKSSPRDPQPQLAFAASLIDRNESNLQSAVKLPAATIEPSAADWGAAWLYLVVGALMLVAADWTLFCRKVLE